MRTQLEPWIGDEVSIFTVRTDATSDHNGHYLGTLRRLDDDALELRERDGNLTYVAFQHIVRFHRVA